MKQIFLIGLLALSGCEWIGRQADAAGEYLPVIGERCENWQCITPAGQAESDAIKRQKAQATASPGQPAPAPAQPQQPPPPPGSAEYYWQHGDEGN